MRERNRHTFGGLQPYNSTRGRIDPRPILANCASNVGTLSQIQGQHASIQSLLYSHCETVFTPRVPPGCLGSPGVSRP